MTDRKNLFILILLVLNLAAEMVSTEPFYNQSFLEELKKCFKTENDYKCKDMILLTERMHLREYYKGNL